MTIDKERANYILRNAIAILRGKAVVSTGLGRIHIALIVKDELKEMGAWWQARILNSWIHRAQKGEFEPQGAENRTDVLKESSSPGRYSDTKGEDSVR